MDEENPISTPPASNARELASQVLHERAEAIMRERVRWPLEQSATTKPEEVQRIFHELQVHQIELEMQNEELRRSQLELVTARSRYFDLYELAPIGYITLSEQGLIRQANLSASNLLDTPRSALIQRPISKIILPADQDIFYLTRKELLVTGNLQICELRIVRSDGKPVWVHLSAAIAQDADGAPEIRLVLTDISGRKQSEDEILRLNALLEQRVRERTAELQASNASLADFKAALDEHALVSISDTSGIILYANSKFCKTSGYSSKELVGQSHRIVNSGYHPPEFFRNLWETITQGRVWRGEIRNRSKEGRLYWVDTTVVPFCDRDGKPVQFIAIRTDVSKRIQAEDALRESEERRRLASEAAGFGVWEWDLASDRIRWDTRMFEIYGMTPTPQGLASYQDWARMVVPEDIKEQESRLQHSIETCGQEQSEFRIVRASDKSVRIIYATQMAIPGPDGRTERVIGINLDITERKLAEEKIRNLNEDLLSRAAELERANRELEAFSYSVSHDLRAPLRAVDGFSRMLAEDYSAKLDDEGRRMIGVICSEARRMGRLIDDLLTFSRLGRQKIESVQIDMGALAREVYEELAKLETGRQLKLDLHPLPPAWGTEAMIRQVWMNLIGNALKFTKGREIAEIEIGAREVSEGEWNYYIKDNGVGFDMRFVDKLFGVFQRLHSQQEFPGTGVGLALVQRVVERHGGRIWAEAEVDHGATFSFTLPNPK